MAKQNKHMPGPWRVGKPSVAHGVQIFRDYEGLRMGSDVICTMPDRGKGRTANARIIAAAPEMYAALKEVFTLLEKHAFDSPWYLRQHYNLMRNTIGKAEGTS